MERFYHLKEIDLQEKLSESSLLKIIIFNLLSFLGVLTYSIPYALYIGIKSQNELLETIIDFIKLTCLVSFWSIASIHLYSLGTFLLLMIYFAIRKEFNLKIASFFAFVPVVLAVVMLVFK